MKCNCPCCAKSFDEKELELRQDEYVCPFCGDLDWEYDQEEFNEDPSTV
jgi:Zn finger protein HypA/HybF involved in hydrogenase expression